MSSISYSVICSPEQQGETLIPHLTHCLCPCTVRHHMNWNTQRLDLREDLAHLVDNTKRRVCGIASAGSPWLFVWSFLVVLKLIARARSKHLRAWGCWYSRGISDDCNDQRRSRSALQGLLGRSNYPVRCGSSMFDAIVRSCPEFADDIARVIIKDRWQIHPRLSALSETTFLGAPQPMTFR